MVRNLCVAFVGLISFSVFAANNDSDWRSSRGPSSPSINETCDVQKNGEEVVFSNCRSFIPEVSVPSKEFAGVRNNH